MSKFIPNSHHHNDAAQALLQIKHDQPSHLETRAASEFLARVILLQRTAAEDKVVSSSSNKQKKKQRSLSNDQLCPTNASAAFLPPPEALYGSSDPSSLSRRAISGECCHSRVQCTLIILLNTLIIVLLTLFEPISGICSTIEETTS